MRDRRKAAAFLRAESGAGARLDAIRKRHTIGISMPAGTADQSGGHPRGLCREVSLDRYQCCCLRHFDPGAEIHEPARFRTRHRTAGICKFVAGIIDGPVTGLFGVGGYIWSFADRKEP